VTEINVALILAPPLSATVVLQNPQTTTALQTDVPATNVSLTTTNDILSAYSSVIPPIAVPGTPPITASISIVSERGATGSTGSTGAVGPQGDPGAGGRSLDFHQTVPSTSWFINHNFNNYPSVTVVDQNGLVEGDVIYNDLNNITINFSSPVTGTAYLV